MSSMDPEKGRSRTLTTEELTSQLYNRWVNLQTQHETLRGEIDELSETIHQLNEDIFMYGSDHDRIFNRKRMQQGNRMNALYSLNEELRKVREGIALLESGQLSEKELRKLVEQDGEQVLSKKKRAIQKERRFLEQQGLNPDEPSPLGLDDSSRLDYSSQPNHLTTGRHARKVQNPDPFDPAGDFFYRTADTHGGKVGHGKQRYKRR